MIKLRNDALWLKGMYKGRFGLEKEHVRVKQDSLLALTPHPAIFGNKLKHPYITNDFSESQVELITPAMEDVQQCYDFLENITDVFCRHMGDEVLWGQSAPPALPDNEDQIPIALFDDSEQGQDAYQYRLGLSKRYGRKKQIISGIHFNFSFDDTWLEQLYQASSKVESFRHFKDQIYLKVSRNFVRHAWLVTYLFGASPVTDRTYLEGCLQHMTFNDAGDPYFPYATSMRNGYCGYRNHNNYIVSYDTVETYVAELKKLISDGKIQDEREYYSPIRLKTHRSDNFLESLLNTGITYLEVRALDLDPFEKNGVALPTLQFMHLFMIFLLFKEEPYFHDDLQRCALENYELAAARGREPGLLLTEQVGVTHELQSMAENLLTAMSDFYEPLSLCPYPAKTLIHTMLDRVQDVQKTLSHQILEAVMAKGYRAFHLALAKAFQQARLETGYRLKGCEDLELSTQILIKDALQYGLQVEIIDRIDNFISLKKDGMTRYVKQATKTDLDSYMTFLVMENKLVTKWVLEQQGIKVPFGAAYNTFEDALEAFSSMWCDRAGFVIKPKSTNFGIGISIFKSTPDYKDYEKAVSMAFEHDTTILIEAFIPGKEYRFFVIADQVVGVLHRVPANVTGDGLHNIQELVAIKNQNPLRGKGYKTPLEIIVCGSVEAMFLKEQGLTFESVIPKDTTIFLRENSNISTGGDSIDYTDQVHASYKTIAVAAAKAVGAHICGVDMMLEAMDQGAGNYAIIELNFNPAIHIHCYPAKGTNRQLGVKLLEALGLI